jgi:hypothetical protein
MTERDPLDEVGPSRRSFIKKMAAVAFVAPVVSSFGMSTLASAGNDKPRHQYPNQPCPPPPPPCPPRKKPKPKKPKRQH